MKANGILLRKLEIISDTVRKLRGLERIDTAKLNGDFFLKKGVERALQICVEAVIDIAHRIVSLEGRTPCSTAGKALEAIETSAAIADASAYKPMVQFRNIVVHRYESVDDAVLVDIVNSHLADFDHFVEEIRRYASG